VRDFYILWSKLILGSLIIVGFFVYSVQSLDNKGTNKNDSKIEQLSIEDIKKDYSFEYDKLFIQCVLDAKDMETCHQEILVQFNGININKEVEVFNRILIYIIYGLLAIVLNTQITLYFFTRKRKEKLEQSFFYIADWSINSAPILGVLGTIIAFALLVSNSQTEDISVLFSKYFFDAAITTLLGGFIYVFNLWLNIFIQPKIASS